MANKTAHGNVIKYDDGKFQLKVTYNVSSSGITFKPYLVCSNNFDHKHVAAFDWTNYKGAKANLTAKCVKGKDTYYPGSGQPKEKNHWWTFQGTQLKIWCYLKKTKYTDKKGKTHIISTSKKSEVIIEPGLKPLTPGGIIVSEAGGRSQSAKVQSSGLKATKTVPVVAMQWDRLTEDITTSGWTAAIGGEHTVNATADSKAYCTLVDQGLSPGNRYKWRLVAKNGPNNSRTTIVEFPKWYYTLPPAVTNVSHVRVDDSTNIIYFSRDPKYHTFRIIKDYLIQYNTYDITDPEYSSGWETLYKPGDKNYNRYPELHPSWNGDIKTEKYTDVAIMHKGCVPGKRYSYRIAAVNSMFGDNGGATGYSEWSAVSGDEPTYNTPGKPTEVKVAPDSSFTKITLTIVAPITKTRFTADRLFIQRKIGESGAWEDIPEGSGTEGIELSNVSVSDDGLTYTYDDTDILEIAGNTVKYRVAFGCSLVTRNGQQISPITVGDGKSEWAPDDNGVETNILAPPSKPNLIMPVDNQKVIIDSDTVRLAWIHSPVDGTAQTNVKIEVKIGESGTWTDVSSMTEAPAINPTGAYYDLPLRLFSVNDTVYWRVATKGSHADYSEYNEKNFKILDRPQIAITSITDMETISYLPISVVWSYQDSSGTIDKLQLNVKKDDEIIYTVPVDLTDLPSANTYVLSDFLFDDEEDYVISITSTSTSGVDASAEVHIKIEYTNLELPNGFNMMAFFDEETGCAHISVERSENISPLPPAPDEDTPPEDEQEEAIIVSDARVRKIYVYRVYNGKTELVEGAVQDINLDEYSSRMAYSFIDRMNPINAEFTYKLLQITEFGEVSVSYETEQFYETLWWYVYWGNDNIIKTRWNPQGSASMGRPQRQEVRYSGREYPVVYDSEANEEAYTYTFTILKDAPIYLDDEEYSGREILEQFKAMMRAGGRGIWKSFEGDVYHAKFDFSWSSNYGEQNAVPGWNCTLNVSRMEGE